MAVSPAALLSVTAAFAKWSPLQQAWNSIGLAACPIFFMTLKLLTDTLPAPAPARPPPMRGRIAGTPC